MTTVCISASWPMGHRLQHHNGKCFWLHGHTYRLEAEFAWSGGLVHQTDTEQPTSGMVEDFKLLKEAVRAVVAGLDHAMMLEKGDPAIMACRPYAEIVEVPYPPTAELIAQGLRKTINSVLSKSLECVRLRLWESDETWAEVRA